MVSPSRKVLGGLGDLGESKSGFKGTQSSARTAILEPIASACEASRIEPAAAAGLGPQAPTISPPAPPEPPTQPATAPLELEPQVPGIPLRASPEAQPQTGAANGAHAMEDPSPEVLNQLDEGADTNELVAVLVEEAGQPVSTPSDSCHPLITGTLATIQMAGLAPVMRSAASAPPSRRQRRGRIRCREPCVPVAPPADGWGRRN